LSRALQDTDMDVRYTTSAEFPDNLSRLMGTDAVVLVNTGCGNFTYQQQEMLCRYVTDLGGGLIMVGGPTSFGAGGWIGSPVAHRPRRRPDYGRGAYIFRRRRMDRFAGGAIWTRPRKSSCRRARW